MTTASESITWTAYQEQLTEFLGIDSGVDEIRLQVWFEMATDICDRYIGREFIPIRARWDLQAGIKSADVFEIKITPDESDEQTATYSATADTAPAVAAYALRDALTTLLAHEAITVSGAGSVVAVASDDPDVPFSHSATYTPGAGTSSILETIWYDAVPAMVRIGVFEFVRSMRQVATRIAGLKAVKTGGLAETYDSNAAAGVAFESARPYWQPFKADLLRDNKAP